MKIKQVSEHIWSLKTWMLIPIHVWVVVGDEGEVTLVDTGMPMMAKGIIKFLHKLDGVSLKQILLTHGHSDHVGAIKMILSERKVPVYAHQVEIPYMTGEKLYPRRKKLENNVSKNVIQPLPEDEKGNLTKIAGLTPFLTPGHSPGHVVYYHEEDQVLLAGDLFTSKNGKLHKPIPMFTADMNEAVRSSVILEKLQPKQLEVCHGGSVVNPASQLYEYMRGMENELMLR
ncbi:MBL fold metallo-hydrolase [Oceanobacillus salinisoli]|uniref:MBL fold metallo-hydrolase n=1 Tax=Oceanobacillus salinisoli TaxID=2678611 RepID=UPI0012E144A0|nr:MBL fold metallo-hydrolase [Oceanobacillus salinisoli]